MKSIIDDSQFQTARDDKNSVRFFLFLLNVSNLKELDND